MCPLNSSTGLQQLLNLYNQQLSRPSQLNPGRVPMTSSKPPEQLAELEALRQQLRELDQQIISTVKLRCELSQQIGRLKKSHHYPLRDSVAEEQVRELYRQSLGTLEPYRESGTEKASGRSSDWTTLLAKAIIGLSIDHQMKSTSVDAPLIDFPLVRSGLE